MKRFVWNLSVAWHLRILGNMPLRIGYGIARCDDDGFNDGLTPREIAENEMSYWEE